MDKGNRGFIVKEDLLLELLNNPDFLSVYNIDPEEIPQELAEIETQEEQTITYPEFVDFVKQPRDELPKAKLDAEFLERLKLKFLPERVNPTVISPPVCLLKKDIIDHMRDIYEDIDRFKELTIPRKLFLDRLRMDSALQKILQIPAVFIPLVKNV